MNNVYGTAGPNSIWITTALGDVYVFDPAIAEVKQICVVVSSHYFANRQIVPSHHLKFHRPQEYQLSEDGYVQKMDVTGKDLPFESILQNGFGYGSSLKVAVCVHDDADR